MIESQHHVREDIEMKSYLVIVLLIIAAIQVLLASRTDNGAFSRA